MVEVKFTVNGELASLQVEATEVLTDTLRDRLGLTGTKRPAEQATVGPAPL